LGKKKGGVGRKTLIVNERRSRGYPYSFFRGEKPQKGEQDGYSADVGGRMLLRSGESSGGVWGRKFGKGEELYFESRGGEGNISSMGKKVKFVRPPPNLLGGGTRSNSSTAKAQALRKRGNLHNDEVPPRKRTFFTGK